MAKVIMVQGTMSGAGKSMLVAGLCRIFKQDGYRVAPFKSQNMALNSFVTGEGLEMGRAQVMQAEAAGMEPTVLMNPILLKPTTHTGSQVIIKGEVMGNMSARDYFACKKQFMPMILEAYEELASQVDIVVVEGAGSPAEINLKENDIVNMGLAEALDAPVILVGDIDRGGVFAQLLGTLMLLEEKEQERVRGLVVNKFRGDPDILMPGIRMLEERGAKPVVGIVPYMDVDLEEEDSLTERFSNRNEGLIHLAVIRYPRISNYTDLAVFERMQDVAVHYVTDPGELEDADMILLPGSKNTMGDLDWMRQKGLDKAICKAAERKLIWGICGGYQMLGESISDPEGVERGGAMKGLGLLPLETVLEGQKVRTRCSGKMPELEGRLSPLSGMDWEGYEIHMGRTRADSMVSACGNVYGSYVHGIFDKGKIARRIAEILAEEKGVVLEEDTTSDYATYKEEQYDRLAGILREHLDMQAIYDMM